MTSMTEEELAHYGIMGMKWGVRKDDPAAGDFVVSKTNPLYSISADKPRDGNGQVYAAFKKKDVLEYRSGYANQLKVFNGANKVFSNAFDLKKDLKVAGKTAQLDVFKNLWEKDKKGIATALARSQVDISVTAAIVNRVFKIDRTNAYEKRFMEASEKYMLNKGFKQFQSALAVPGNNYKTPYYEKLAKRGYTALLDLNDLKAMGTDQPVLVFKGKNVLKNRNTVELTDDDIDLAVLAWQEGDGGKYNVGDIHSKVKHDMTEEEILAHYGIKGMRWGVRKKADRPEPSKDAARAGDIRTKAKTGKVKALTNAELQEAITRMNLEQNYKRLAVNDKPVVTRFIASTLMEIGKREVQAALVKKAGKLIAKSALGGA